MERPTADVGTLVGSHQADLYQIHSQIYMSELEIAESSLNLGFFLNLLLNPVAESYARPRVLCSSPQLPEPKEARELNSKRRVTANINEITKFRRWGYCISDSIKPCEVVTSQCRFPSI